MRCPQTPAHRGDPERHPTLRSGRGVDWDAEELHEQFEFVEKRKGGRAAEHQAENEGSQSETAAGQDDGAWHGRENISTNDSKQPRGTQLCFI